MTPEIDATTVDELRELMGRYPQARSALLPMLHLLQSVQGQVTAEGIELCAELLGLTAAEVSGVATFYTMYKRRPMGTHHVGVCTNTLCAVMGGDAIYERLSERLGIGNDETTEDGAVTLERIECNAACDHAPVLTVNWEFMDSQTPQSAVELVEKLRAGETVTATRGATITSWREAERVVAGFEDGRVDEGPAAAGPSLAGLEIARQRGWTAPAFDEGSDAAAAEAEQVGEESPQQAAAESDSGRAATETAAAESPAGTRGGGSPQGEDEIASGPSPDDSTGETATTGETADEGGSSDD
ncbi:NADH-quinone oxidoreductase subunit NuoE [Aeromicrobium halocynthiae]